IGAAEDARRLSRVTGDRPSTLTMRSPHSTKRTSLEDGKTRKSGATKKPGYGRPTRAARAPSRISRVAAVRATRLHARGCRLTISPDHTREPRLRRGDTAAQPRLDRQGPT